MHDAVNSKVFVLESGEEKEKGEERERERERRERREREAGNELRQKPITLQHVDKQCVVETQT